MKIEEAPKFINDVLYRLVNKNVEYTLKLIEKRVLNIQSKFFTYLVNKQGIIGASKAPVFQGENLLSSPRWDLRFSKQYAASKPTQYKNKFFINTGELKNSLKGLQSSNIFGRPIILFNQPGSKSNRTFTSSKNGFIRKGSKGFKATQQIGNINIDLFPKLETGFQSQFNEDFYTKFFNQKQTAEAGKKPVFIGMKLDNKYTKRPFIGQYMQWWAKVKVKQSVLKGVA